jgi:hypothetical protein
MKRALTGLALLLVLLGCGDSGRAQEASHPSEVPRPEAITEAYEAMLAAGTGHILERFILDIAGNSLTTVTEGQFDAMRERVRLRVHFEVSSPEAANLLLGKSIGDLDDLVMEIVRADGIAYMTMPNAPAWKDGGWLRIDENNEQVAAVGADLDSPAPTKGLGLVEAMAPPDKAVTTGGVTQYSTTVPSDDAVQLLSARFVAERVRSGEVDIPKDPVAAAVTVDPNGRISAISYDLTTLTGEIFGQLASRTPSPQISGRHEVHVDRFGEPVDIRLPNKNDIIDPDEVGQ